MIQEQCVGEAPIGVEELDHVVHALHVSGALARLTDAQVENILYALRAAGRLGRLFTEAGLPRVAPEQLDHVVHAMRLSGGLGRLTDGQSETILHALHAEGRAGRWKNLAGAAYDDGHLISFHNADFLDDPRFAEAYRLGRATDSWQGFDVRWRVYFLCWAAAHAKTLEGDFVECGVNRGGFSRAVMHYIDYAGMAGRPFYLLDTYCGIPEVDRDARVDCYFNAYPDCHARVVETFRPFPAARVIRGRVPDTLSQVPSEKVCYLSIDMNCVGPEIAAAEFFWDKLVPGAVLVLDDYGAGKWHLPQKEAFDRFAREKGVEILTLPTCQGFLIKP